MGILILRFLRRSILRRSTLDFQVLSIVLVTLMGFVVSSCDSDNGGAEKVVSETSKEFEGSAEAGEGSEAAKEAMKKKQEAVENELEARKGKNEERTATRESIVRTSPGIKKR